MKNILIVAGAGEAYYYQPFVEACSRRGVAVYVFDPARFPSEASLSIKSDGSGIDGFIDVVKPEISGNVDAHLKIKDITVAWWLREGLMNRPKCHVVEDRFRENESANALRSFLSVLPCRWVNKREAVDLLASNKLFQQIVARQSGLLTPDTLVSNHPESVASFSSQHNGLLLKSLGYIKLDEERKYHLYSQRFSHDELAAASESIRQCPVFSQEYVEKLCEHRVMVIGDKVLSCRIDSQASEKTKVDWRHYDFEKVRHSVSVLPTIVQDNLKAFMQKVDLRYGAIDLIETPKGEFVFLEVNPSGQWGWIADLADLPIPEAVADMLESI